MIEALGANLRQQPRFIDEQRVEVEFANREELKEAWTVDISKGGMFIRTPQPPPHGTRLEIKFQMPDGRLVLTAEVVHVVDPESAVAFNQPAGVGVQFVDLSKEVREKIEAYVEGLASQLDVDLTGDVASEPIEVLVQEARRVMEALNASKLYEALDVPPSATTDEIDARVEELCQRFAHPPHDSPPPKVARLQRAARALDRASGLFKNSHRRLHYDFQSGFVRAEERLSEGQDAEHLREVWKEIFPDRVGSAKDLLRKALQKEQLSAFDECCKLVEQALQLDPFNQDLRRAREKWKNEETVGARQKTAQAADASAVEEDVAKLGARIAGMSYFEVLGVSEEASAQEVARAYLEKARRFHPDALRGRVSPELLRTAQSIHGRLNTAYKTLSDASARKSYLLQLKAKAAEPATADDAKVHFEMGTLHMRKSEYAEARQRFHLALEVQPNDPELMAAYAWSMIADPSFDRSIAFGKGRELLDAALERTTIETPVKRKRSAQYHYYLGRLHREQGDTTTALAEFKRALELWPKLAEASTEVRLIQLRSSRSEEEKGSLRGLFKRGS